MPEQNTPVETADDAVYTSTPKVIRVYHEDHGDEYPWCVDGAQTTREVGPDGTLVRLAVEKYTEHVARYRTLDEALSAVPLFISDTQADGVQWEGIK